MAKEKKTDNPAPKAVCQKVCINVDFEQYMKLLAVHANARVTRKITYNTRNSQQK